MLRTGRLGAALAALCIIAISATWGFTRERVQSAVGDVRLTDVEVMGWFNGNLPAGPVRPGNEVIEIVDGPEAYRQMAAAIRSASRTSDPANPPALTLTPLRNLGPGPDEPVWCMEPGWIAEDDQGNLLTTSTSVASALNRGRVFRLSPDGLQQDVLHKFTGPDGDAPRSGLMRAKDGGFYGTTYAGGKYGTGSIFRIDPGKGYGVVWDFRNGTIDPPKKFPEMPTEQEKLDAAGSYPISPPVQATNGKLYGVSTYANNQQYGVLYSLSPYHGMYFFKGDQGRLPLSLIAGSDGNLYGTTLKGDATCPNGTIFRATASGSVTAIHKFKYETGHTSHSIAQGRDGHLYGTASTGPAGKAGVIYKVTLPEGKYEVIYTFSGGLDGGWPIAGVVHARDGYLYGATTGSTGGRGTIYRVRPDGTGFRALYNFPSAVLTGTGRMARVTLVEHSKAGVAGDPLLYGITYQGGQYDRGVFYRLEAPRFVYLSGWWLSDNFPLVADDPASTIQSLFKEASDKGAQVRALLWDSNESGDQKLFGSFKRNTAEVDRINGLAQGAAILDNRTLNIGSHHQKLLIVGGADGLTAFTGGVDINPDRMYPKGLGPNAGGNTEGAPLHDVHCRIKGPAVGDLLKIFAQRWNDHPKHVEGDDKLKSQAWGTRELVPDPIPGATCWVQVGRTYGNGTTRMGINGPLTTGAYSFAPSGEQTAAGMIVHAIRKAQKFIYLEDQYFVDTAPSVKQWNVRNELLMALAKPTFQHLTVVIPHGDITMMGNPAAGIPNQVSYRRKLLIDALKKSTYGHKVHIFYRSPLGPSDLRVPHTYVHSKTWIFDDQFAIIGSANTNRRSWTHDSEIMVGICDQGKADGSALLLPHRLRMRLWAEHLNLRSTPYEVTLRNGADNSLWKNLPAGANVAPYTEIKPETAAYLPGEKDLQWDKIIDPDGS